MQEGLQKFNFEVLISKTMLDMILHMDKQWDIAFYPVIILSESLSNKELKKIVPKLKEKHVIVFRKYLSSPSVDEKEALKDFEIDEWIDCTIPTDSLRELISKYMDSSSPLIQEKENQLIAMSLDQLVMNFTKNQNKCFQKLYNPEAPIISREELCQHIWEEEPTNSNLAQLSVLIKSLRRKLAEKGFPHDIIETVWGKGYVLRREFYTIYREYSLSNKD